MAEITVHYEGPIVTRAEAKATGLTRFFTGKPCVNGHLAERYVGGKACIVCLAARGSAWKKSNPDRVKVHTAKRYEEHGERLKEKRREKMPEMRCKQCNKIIPFQDALKEGYKYRTRKHYCSIGCRLWSKVDRRGDSECWVWVGAKHYFGYGIFGEETAGVTKQYTAHTVSWMIANNREIPDGMFVMHSCDNPECTNPAHLSLGTSQDNIDDMVRKGRNQKGEGHAHAKLTEDQVREIRADTRYQCEIAEEYGICQQAVSDIKLRINWKHVR